MTTPTDSQLREFLLRRTAPAEAQAIEDAIILEDGVAERLRAEELDLIDDGAAGSLSAADAAAVEEHLLSSAENRHSMRIGRLLARRSGANEPQPVAEVPALRRRRFKPWQLGAVGGLIAAGIAGVALIPHLNPAVPVASAGRSVLVDAPTERLPVVALLAAVERGTAPSIQHFKANPAGVRLQVEVPDPQGDALYSVRVADDTDRVLFERAGLAPRTAGPYRFVEAVVPSDALGGGARIISLRSSGTPPGTQVKYTWHIVGVAEP